MEYWMSYWRYQKQHVLKGMYVFVMGHNALSRVGWRVSVSTTWFRRRPVLGNWLLSLELWHRERKDQLSFGEYQFKSLTSKSPNSGSTYFYYFRSGVTAVSIKKFSWPVKKSSPLPLWGYRLPVTALALSARRPFGPAGFARGLDRQSAGETIEKHLKLPPI